MRTHACTCTKLLKEICFPADGTGLVLLTTRSKRGVSALELQSRRERPFRTRGRLRGSVEQPCQATLQFPENCARKIWMPWPRRGKREKQFRGPPRHQENFERTICLRWWNLHFASSTDAVPTQRCSFTWIHGIMLHPKNTMRATRKADLNLPASHTSGTRAGYCAQTDLSQHNTKLATETDMSATMGW